VSRRFDAWVRSLMYYQAGRHGPASRQGPARRRRPVGPGRSSGPPEQPVRDDTVDRLARSIAYVAAVVLPVLACLAMVVVRDDIDRSTAALVLVLPVVLVAVIGGTGPATLAAAVSSLSFDVFLTRPYYRAEIHAAEEVEATLILLVVGVAVGQLVARETRSRVRSTVRAGQLDALVAVVTAAARGLSEPELAARAESALTDLLDLRAAHWSPGYHGVAHPVLSRTGALVDESGPAIPPDDVRLPAAGVELPVTADDRELGRFVLVPAHRVPVSREERRVAVAIADAFGLSLAERAR
jgi:K+-sensing histidine kinase KdpD